MINHLHAEGPETTEIWLNFISFVDIRMAKVVKICHQMMQEYTLFIVRNYRTQIYRCVNARKT